MQMMNGMVSIVETQIIKRLASEVARKVIFGAHIAPVVLEKVQGQDTVLGVELWEQCKPEPSAPIYQDEHGGSTPDCNLFKLALLYNGSVKTGLGLEIQLVILVSR
jgi:hypothetical protein